MKKHLITAVCAAVLIVGCTKKDANQPTQNEQPTEHNRAIPGNDPGVTSSSAPAKAESIPPQENPGSGEMPTTNPINPAVPTNRNAGSPTTAPTTDGSMQGTASTPSGKH